MKTARRKRMPALAVAGVLSIGGLAACQPSQRMAHVAALTENRISPNGPSEIGAGTSAAAPAVPAVAATQDEVSTAAGVALWALWYDDPSYPDKLAALVPLVAARAGVSADDLSAAWTTAAKVRMIAVLSALTQVGVPYRRYKSAVGAGFDCSGLTSWAWSQAGVTLPRQSLRQIRLATAKTADQVLPGDLVYYPGHVSMALGVGLAIVHAPYTGARVEVRPFFKNRLRTAKVGSPI